jgi:NAD(P)-dependent dehydrogenase (short-subunit alcohol dehydrogenase family)
VTHDLSGFGIAPGKGGAADLNAVAASIQIGSPGRFRNPSEVAQAVVFFASDEPAFTVGSELVVDGG